MKVNYFSPYERVLFVFCVYVVQSHVCLLAVFIRTAYYSIAEKLCLALDPITVHNHRCVYTHTTIYRGTSESEITCGHRSFSAHFTILTG